MNDKYEWITALWEFAEWERQNIMSLRDRRDLYRMCKTLIISDVFSVFMYAHVHLFIYLFFLSHAVRTTHNPAWAVLMYKTLAKREEKKQNKTLIYSFVSDSSTKSKLKGKIRIEQGAGKKKNKKKTWVRQPAPQGRRDLWFVHVLWIQSTGRINGCQSLVVHITSCTNTYMPTRDTCSLPIDLIWGQHLFHNVSCEWSNQCPLN